MKFAIIKITPEGIVIGQGQQNGLSPNLRNLFMNKLPTQFSVTMSGFNSQVQSLKHCSLPVLAHYGTFRGHDNSEYLPKLLTNFFRGRWEEGSTRHDLLLLYKLALVGRPYSLLISPYVNTTTPESKMFLVFCLS